MLRQFTVAIILSACADFAQPVPDLSGTWGFTHANDQFQGWIVLRQDGDVLQGTWHTSKGKDEPDDVVSGRIRGNSATLWRFIGNNKQSFALTLSENGNRLDGFGDGFFLNHTNLNMQRSTVDAGSKTTTTTTPKEQPPAIDLSGLWSFTHFNDRFQGTVTLHREGSYFAGTWHTSKGKVEPDDTVSARIDGNTVTLWRFIGNAQQYYTLTLSADKSRLDGYGDGFFLNHTNLNMARYVDSQSK